VGARTWGGLVGIGGYPSLMDGGYVTAPREALWAVEGDYAVENKGVAPDVAVDEDPAAWRAGHDSQLERAVAVRPTAEMFAWASLISSDSHLGARETAARIRAPATLPPIPPRSRCTHSIRCIGNTSRESLGAPYRVLAAPTFRLVT
jgi:hypothetical protein